MSSKKSRKAKSARADKVQPDPVPAAPEASGLWPAEFAAPRTAVMIAAMCGVLSLAWLALGLNNGLIAAKYLGAYFLGFYDPTDLGPMPGSFDLASVLTGFTLMIGGTLIHPACGLVVLLAIRPWLDGYTFPSDNIYFLWGTILIFVLWGVRTLLRGESLRTGPHVVLLLSVVILQVITALDSIQFAKSYRHLLLWANYFFLFLLVINTLKTRRTIQFVLFSITVVAGLQAAFAILQYYFIFPYLRVLLNERADLRQQFFGISEWTPELAHRFNVNRAFGTVLFPNSFAAFIILLLPHVALQAIQNFRANTVEAVSLAAADVRRRRAVAAGFAAWLAGICAVFAALQMPATYAVGPLRGEPLTGWWADTTGLLIASVIGGGLIGLSIAFYVDRRGLAACGRLLYRLSYAAAALTMTYALYLSFSRGGMLALFVACVIGAVIYRTPETRLPARLRSAVAAALILLAAGAAVYQPKAHAQQVQMAQAQTGEQAPAALPGQRSTEVTEAGQAANLGGTESFRLRFSYWKVALRVFRDHMLGGVGLGALEWAYPAYQEIGDGDVREAHNGYLQALAETGIFGGVLLILFWAAVLLYAALRVVREQDRGERLLLAGLFTGILAFLGQAFIDINFQHPSLMFFVFLMTGIFFARTTLFRAEEEGEGGYRNWLLLPALAIAALTVGMSMRVYTQDLSLSRMRFMAASKDKELEHRYEVGNFYFGTVVDHAMKKNPNKPTIPLRSARVLIRDLEALKQVGTFYVRNPNTTGVRRLAAGETIPDHAILRIDRPWDAYGLARSAGIRWVAELEAMDARFPHDPQLANHIANWHSMMAERLIASRHMQDKRESVANQIRWIEEAIDRSPMYADLYVAAATAYWTKGGLAEDPEEQRAAYVQALEHIERAPALARAMPQYEHLVAYAYRRLATAYDSPATREQQKRFTALADEHQALGDAIYARRNELGLFTQPYANAMSEASNAQEGTQ